jgi:hypothetical protein
MPTTLETTINPVLPPYAASWEWPTLLRTMRTDIDSIMGTQGGYLREKIRAVCYYLAFNLPKHGTLSKNALNHLMWAPQGKTPAGMAQLLLALGILPSDRLWNAVYDYFLVIVPSHTTQNL